MPTTTTYQLALGNSIHLALEKLYGPGPSYFPVLSLEEATKLFLDDFHTTIEEKEVFVTYPNLVKSRNEGIEMLANYFGKLERNELPNPVAVENSFRLPIVEGAEIVGKIDKTELDEDGEYTVIDYKSGKEKPTEWFLRRSMQFTCYAYACKELYGKFPKKVVWHHLRTGQLLESTRDDWDIDQLIRTIGGVVKMRDQGITFRTYHEKVCNWCEFQGSICDDPHLEQQILELRERERRESETL